MSFARPDLLPLALIVPALLLLALWLYARRRRQIAHAFSDPHLLERLGGAQLLRFPVLRVVLIVTAGLALGFSAAGPQWGLRATDGRALSLNVVIAADISRSMLAPDLEPNRLERSRLFARRLLRELRGDRFGLVVFAGRAYVLSPLTVDHSAVELYLDALDPGMVSQGGSSLSSALTQATDLVRGSETGGDRVVILLSDGEALEELDAVSAAADRAARAGIKIIAVGVGTTAGSTIPDVDETTGLEIGVKRDEYGEVVITRLDDALLRMIADRTDGTYVRLDEGNAINRVVADLRRMQRAEGQEARRLEPKEQFAWFAAVALLLLCADMLLFGAGLKLPQQARARAAAIIIVLLATSAYGIGDLERGNRLYREGRYEEAIAAYQRVVEAGDASAQVHYNLGTALLAVGRFPDAEQHFQRALGAVDPELRQHTFYNLGNRFLTEGRAEVDVARQGELLDAAIEAYRRSLRIEPDDVDAKWNLELALRDREENEQRQQNMPQQQDQQSDDPDEDSQQQQQPGGGGGSGAQGQAGEGQDDGSATDQQPMSQEEADRILSAIEQDERELTREKLRRGERRTPVLRDW